MNSLPNFGQQRADVPAFPEESEQFWHKSSLKNSNTKERFKEPRASSAGTVYTSDQNDSLGCTLQFWGRSQTLGIVEPELWRRSFHDFFAYQ